MGFGNPGIVKLRFDNVKVQGWYCLAGSDRGYLTAYLTCTTRSRHQNYFRALAKSIPFSDGLPRVLEVDSADGQHGG